MVIIFIGMEVMAELLFASWQSCFVCVLCFWLLGLTSYLFHALGLIGLCMTSSLYGKYEEGDIAEKLKKMYEVYILNIKIILI